MREVVRLLCMLVLLRELVSKHLTDASIVTLNQWSAPISRIASQISLSSPKVLH